MVRYTSLKKAAFGLFLPVLALQMHTTKTSHQRQKKHSTTNIVLATSAVCVSGYGLFKLHQYTNALARNNAIIALYRPEITIVQRSRSTAEAFKTTLIGQIIIKRHHGVAYPHVDYQTKLDKDKQHLDCFLRQFSWYAGTRINFEQQSTHLATIKQLIPQRKIQAELQAKQLWLEKKRANDLKERELIAKESQAKSSEWCVIQ